MNGITIVAISEKEGQELLSTLHRIDETLEAILDRVKRIPGQAVEAKFTLGKVIQQ